MQGEETGTSEQASPSETGRLPATAGRWLMRAFPAHVRAFLVANAALNVVNVFTGAPWWAFWVLAATGFLLAVHYLFYKATVVDERWVDARVEELNLKSYDRSHIEGLKTRHGAKNTCEHRGS